jgi:hypothetical protein
MSVLVRGPESPGPGLIPEIIWQLLLLAGLYIFEFWIQHQSRKFSDETNLSLPNTINCKRNKTKHGQGLLPFSCSLWWVNTYFVTRRNSCSVASTHGHWSPHAYDKAWMWLILYMGGRLSREVFSHINEWNMLPTTTSLPHLSISLSFMLWSLFSLGCW